MMMGEGENMFKKKLSVVTALLVLGTTSAFAATIAGSPHDLSATTTGDNGELCVYCHTPHAGNTALTGAPLWNKANLATASFTMYGAVDAASAGSTIAQATTVAEPSNSSLACLSCHDGVSSIDSIVNAPGSGMNTITGSVAIGAVVGGINENADLTADLTNTHPISVEYIPGNASLVPKTTVLTGWQGAATIQDLLRGVDDRVECGSCHDPHNGTALTTAEREVEVNFLRHTNAGSALCLGCHNK